MGFVDCCSDVSMPRDSLQFGGVEFVVDGGVLFRLGPLLAANTVWLKVQLRISFTDTALLSMFLHLSRTGSCFEMLVLMRICSWVASSRCRRCGVLLRAHFKSLGETACVYHRDLVVDWFECVGRRCEGS